MLQLEAGECDQALACGINLVLAPDVTVSLSQNRMMAPDGLCKTFSAGGEFVEASAVHMDVYWIDDNAWHLHEHFEEPVTIRRGRYMPPTKPGYSITIKPDSRRRYQFPDGEVWRDGH